MSRRLTYAQRRGSYVRWGAATLLLAAALSYWAFGLPLPSFGGTEVRAVLSSANELRPDSPVRIAGVEVGKVTKVERGPGTTALVTMKLSDHGLPLHRDATLKVRPRLFLEGNFFVDLRPGSPSAPVLADGDTIPLAQTATPVQLDQVLGALPADTRDDLESSLEELGSAARRGGAQGLARGLEPAGGAFKGAAIVSASLRGERPHDLSQAIANVGRVTAALDSRREELAGLVRGLDGTAGALAARDAELAATVRELDGVLREAEGTLPAIRPAIRAVRALAPDARPLVRRLPATLDHLRPLLREAEGLLSPRELPATARALRPALRTLARTQPPLEELLGLVTPVTDCVRDQALPVLTAKLDDGQHSTGQPVWLELLHAIVGQAGASANFDGNGPAIRYFAGFGEQMFSTGQVPGFGRLQGLTAAEVEGARPMRPAVKPPFRPDAECRRQKPIDLRADAIGAPPGEPAPEPSDALLDLVRDTLEEVLPEAAR